MVEEARGEKEDGDGSDGLHATRATSSSAAADADAATADGTTKPTTTASTLSMPRTSSMRRRVQEVAALAPAYKNYTLMVKVVENFSASWKVGFIDTKLLLSK